MTSHRRIPRPPEGPPRYPGRGVVRVGPLVSILTVLHELGHDPRPLLADAGLTTRQFDESDTTIPYPAAGRLLANCATATGIEHFGLLVGERVDPSQLGIAGYLLRVAMDVGTALGALVDYLDLHDRGGLPVLVTSDGVTALGYAINIAGVEGTDQIYDLSTAISYKIMRTLCGDGWTPNEILLSRRRPDDERPYRRFFRSPLRFDADQSAVVFPDHWLEHRLPTADPFLYHHLLREAGELQARLGIDLASELRSLLRRRVGRQECSAAAFAAQLGIHERTLNRRLHEEGTSFREELNCVRRLISEQLLAGTGATIAEIAISVGYADVSTFSRAFKRWSGTAPAQWRLRNRQA